MLVIELGEFAPINFIETLIFALSCVLLFILQKFTQPSHPETTFKVSRKRRPMNLKTHVLFGAFGLALGIALYALAAVSYLPLTVLCFIAGALATWLDVALAKGIYPDRMKRVVCIGICVLYLAILALPDTPFVLWDLFGFILAFFLTTQLCWAINTTHRFRLSVTAFLTEAQVLIWLGMAIGLVASILFVEFQLNPNWLFCSVVAITIICFAFLTPKDLNGLALLEFQDFDQDKDSFVPENQDSNAIFIAICKELSQAYNLTTRETEIFELLAKGRNADAISKKLVISKYTTKTHIYHIYQKIGIKSQQELMDMVESSLS